MLFIWCLYLPTLFSYSSIWNNRKAVKNTFFLSLMIAAHDHVAEALWGAKKVVTLITSNIADSSTCPWCHVQTLYTLVETLVHLLLRLGRVSIRHSSYFFKKKKRNLITLTNSKHHVRILYYPYCEKNLRVLYHNVNQCWDFSLG